MWNKLILFMCFGIIALFVVSCSYASNETDVLNNNISTNNINVPSVDLKSDDYDKNSFGEIVTGLLTAYNEVADTYDTLSEEQKTDYQALYFSLKGVDGYFAMKINNEEKVNLGKEIDLYLPYQRINVYDQDHNKVNSREVVFDNVVNATVKNEKGQMVNG